MQSDQSDTHQDVGMTADTLPRSHIMPPFTILRDFLDEETAAELLAFGVAHESEFAPTALVQGKIDPAIRTSRGTRDLGRFRALLTDKLTALQPELVAGLGMGAFELARIELELVAHGDGDFFKRHTDTRFGPGADSTSLRLVSGVYYLHGAPRVFSGGALRLFAIGGRPEADFVDVEPHHNSLVLFPSWAPHEVMPIHSPSSVFADSRFAINCWLHAPRKTS